MAHDAPIGQRFGRLVVVSEAPKRENKNGKFTRCGLCQCDCGNKITVRFPDLRRGNTQSCGCLARETLLRRNVKHGLSRTPTHKAWTEMRQRCFNENNDYYEDYGGRGITLCPRWQDFENFVSDMGERPEGTSLDRINNNGNYEPGNCRWATPVEQARNRRSNWRVPFGGRAMTLKEASELAGVNYHKVHKRITRLGWTVERALQP